MIKTGIILSFNKLAGVGVLKDSNNQTIKYHAENDKLHLLKGDVVSFDIGFHNKRLIATNLKLLNRPIVGNI